VRRHGIGMIEIAGIEVTGGYLDALPGVAGAA
jgi:hypothetical protein